MIYIQTPYDNYDRRNQQKQLEKSDIHTGRNRRKKSSEEIVGRNRRKKSRKDSVRKIRPMKKYQHSMVGKILSEEIVGKILSERFCQKDPSNEKVST